MPADQPTILATSGGAVADPRLRWRPGPLTELAVDLAGVEGTPKICFLATALGDDQGTISSFYAAASARGWQPSHLQLFPMPNHADVAEQLCDVDVVWVWGGSVAGLLAMWRLHGVDTAMREAWQRGVVLTGVSAGSICWHVGGTTDSFGPELRPITDGLALLPYSNGVHYDSEQQRRPLFQSLIAEGTLPDGYATDDGAGLLYRGDAMVQAYAERPGAGAYAVRRAGPGEVEETALEVERL